jgi:phenylalanyl-tRNA synthetase beta chain
MKFSVNWMSEFTGPTGIGAGELANQITVKTAEQEGVEAVGAHFAQVCAARVESVEPIEGSKNVRAVVDTGRYGTRTVVCGAPNCRTEMITAYWPVGTARISGVDSDGMLASGAELGINRDSAGVLELAGVEPGAAIPGCGPDSVIEIDNKSLTHRPDLWGHLGMAREVAAILGTPLRDPVDMGRIPSGAAAIKVEIEDTSLCPRYSALVFDNVTVGPSPLWLQYRLEAVGLNPINNIVDVTNYVMAELAQPMHAFDHDRLSGDTIFVRRAREGERVVALNNEAYHLDGQALVIADAAGPVAIAGVIGGLDSGVTAATRRIVFESANFHAGSVRKTSARLKVRTDASMRFEKSQDPRNTVRGLARAAELLALVSPGIRLVGGLADAGRELPAAPVIELDAGWLGRKLGRGIDAGEARGILESLGFGVDEDGPGALAVTVPSWRATKDISIKDDLVEEVGRMLGYGSIAPRAPAVPATPPPGNPEREFLHGVRAACAAQGFHEAYNYSFVNQDQLAELGMDPADHVRVLNPIASDQGLLRTSLVPGVVRNVRDNARHLDEFRLFEIGCEIHRRVEGLPNEVPHLAAVVFARHGSGEPGLQEAKRLVECLLPGAVVRPAAARVFEHPVRAWEVVWRDRAVGRLAEWHPRIVEGRAAVLDLDLGAVREMGTAPVRYRPLRRFPTSAFDLSIVAAKRDLVGDLERILVAHGGEHLQSVEFVRRYSGPPLPEDRQSVSFRVTVGAADRTLSTQEIAAARDRLIQAARVSGYDLRI